jgi:CRISPR type III-B/RAMP module-associated protein Cmr5
MTIERKIAGKARELVGRERETNAAHPKETSYRSLCESFPILLRGAGLAQTVSYLKAKSKKEEYGALHDHLEQQFRGLGLLEKGALSEKVADPGMSHGDYRLYSQIAMQAALWHKRLAQALLRKKDEQ